MPDTTLHSTRFVPLARRVDTQLSLTGGGQLNGDLILSLVNDTAPAPFSYYGTDIFGTRKWLGSFGASGVLHAAGLVPDPGTVAGTTRFLCETGEWVVVTSGAGGAVDSVFGRTGNVVAQQSDYDAFFLTQTEGDARYSLLGHTHTFASITGKPTTVAGYGITDAQPLDSDLTLISTATPAASYYYGTDVSSVKGFYALPASGGSGTSLTRDVVQTAHGFAVGNVVRFNGTAYVKAQANTSSSAEAIGIVSVVADADHFTLHLAGRITGLSGLTAGLAYFLSDATAGLLTATEPSATGAVSKPLLIADSATSGYFNNWRGKVNASPLTFDMSLNLSGTSVTLDNDNNAPGNSLYYGTNLSGTKGFFNITQLGAGTGTALTKDINQTAHGLSVGNIVRLSGASYIKAKADIPANAEAAGIVSAVIDANNFTLQTGGRIATLTGLTAGTVYFLDPVTAGALTTTEPTTAGVVSKPQLIADTTTSGYYYNFRGNVVPSNVIATGAMLQTGALLTTPINNATAVQVMAGLGAAGAVITPTASGKIYVSIRGICQNNTAANGVQMQVRYGTGAAPASNAAATGTAVGAAAYQNYGASSGANSEFEIVANAVITGLPIGVQHWLDVGFQQWGTGTATLSYCQVSAHELGAPAGLAVTGFAAPVYSPQNPTGTTSTTGVMMGLGTAWKMTPTATGRMVIVANGVYTNSVAGGLTSAVLYWGTGTAPVNGAASTGGVLGQQTFAHIVNPSWYTPFSMTSVAQGTVGTPYWFDLKAWAGAAGQTATVYAGSFYAYEIP